MESAPAVGSLVVYRPPDGRLPARDHVRGRPPRSAYRAVTARVAAVLTDRWMVVRPFMVGYPRVMVPVTQLAWPPVTS